MTETEAAQAIREIVGFHERERCAKLLCCLGAEAGRPLRGGGLRHYARFDRRRMCLRCERLWLANMLSLAMLGGGVGPR